MLSTPISLVDDPATAGLVIYTGAVVFEYDGAADHADGRVTARRVGGDPKATRTDTIVAANHYIERNPPTSEDNSTDRAALLRSEIEDWEARRRERLGEEMPESSRAVSYSW